LVLAASSKNTVLIANLRAKCKLNKSTKVNHLKIFLQEHSKHPSMIAETIMKGHYMLEGDLKADITLVEGKFE
jgi:hypothetical protein